MSIELIQAAQQAVDAFDAFGDADDFASLFALTQKMHALRTAIQQAESEPVAWAPVPEFEDLYEVSSLGEIRSMVTGKVLAKNKMGAGYIKADLWKDGSRKQTSVHRVVASAFLGDLTGLEVNHINGDKTDNRVSNLELATRSENERHSRSKLKNLVKPVLARNLTTGNILEFESVEAAARFGFVPSSIYRCCYGICKKHRGYEFAFKNPSHADGKKATTHPAPGVPGALKDHQISALVNKVRDIARMFHGHQSLRERIAIELVPALKASQDVQSNAERWIYAIADGGNQSMNFIDIFDDWDGDGSFVEVFDAARIADKKGGAS